MDTTTAFARLVVGALGGGHPIRLLAGVSLSFIAKTMILLFAKMNPESVFWDALDQLSVLWIIVMVAPLLFIPVIWRRYGAPEAAIHQASTIRMLLEEAGIKGAQRQMFWHSFIDRYIKSLKPDLSEAPPLRKVVEETINELKE